MVGLVGPKETGTSILGNPKKDSSSKKNQARRCKDSKKKKSSPNASSGEIRGADGLVLTKKCARRPTPRPKLKQKAETTPPPSTAGKMDEKGSQRYTNNAGLCRQKKDQLVATQGR